MQKADTAFPLEAINLFAVNCQLYQEPIPSFGKSWKVNERIHQGMRSWLEEGDG